jgi:hypothetical protein
MNRPGDLAALDEYSLLYGAPPVPGEQPIDPRSFTSSWAREATANPGPYEANVGMFPPVKPAKVLPDVGPPMIGDGGQFSPGTALGNRLGEYGTRAGEFAVGLAVPQDAMDVGLSVAGLRGLRGLPGARAIGGGLIASTAADEAEAAKRIKLPKRPSGFEGPMPGSILAPEAVMPPEQITRTFKFPQYAEQYPPTGAGVPTIDPNSGKPYMAKANTPDAEAFAKERTAIQNELDKGYDPYFDPAKRFHVDPKDYPPMLDTAEFMPKTAKALEKWTHEFDVPETRAALQRAYASGQKVKDAEHWYMMGQLEREYVKELGEEAGRQRFRTDFGGAMAATTGGADPTSNLLMGHYANFLRYKGEDFPRVSAAENQQVKDFAESQGKAYVDKKGRPIDKTGDIASYSLPFPIGGQYASGNLDQYERVFKEVASGKDIAKALEDANPKRLDFMQSFTGNPASFTWDKQMTSGATQGRYDAPDLGYGILQRIAREEAAKAGKDPQEFQGVGWAGFKGEVDAAKTLGGKFQGPRGFGNVKYEGPMISHVNDTIERTHRLTGMPREEIVRRGLVRAEIPLYGLGGAMTMGALARQDGYDPR